MNRPSSSSGSDSVRVEHFASEGNRIVRQITLRTGAAAASYAKIGRLVSAEIHSEFDLAWLRSRKYPIGTSGSSSVRVVDLFSGCGAMSLGIAEACRALNLGFQPVLAVEFDRTKAGVYHLNFKTATVLPVPIESVLDRRPNLPLSSVERSITKEAGRVDLLIGGPPCQGHSDLNNRTRRSDPRNQLYLRMIRAAEVLRPANVLIENVPGVRHDRGGVLEKSVELLESFGYQTEVVTLYGERLGVPQRRKRTFLLAAHSLPRFEHEEFETASRAFSWACSDLSTSTSVLDSPSTASKPNRKRIEFLFRTDLFDLPNRLRPSCHRDKAHSYKSMYGRLRWDEPSQTITTGFGSMGQGRYVHPREPRTITPHEAARLQFIPDFFDFGDSSRGALAEMIGNAVPPKLSYVLALHLLR
ncbi:MAG: DNA cytosine methyltransferase [Thermoanaerobaculia bacterium]